MNYDDEPYEYEPEEFTLFPTEGKYIINAFIYYFLFKLQTK